MSTLQEIADKEGAWFAREKEANENALRRVRALCPVGVTGLTVAQLEQRACEAGSLYPRELALRLKVRTRAKRRYEGRLGGGGGRGGLPYN